MAGAKLPEAVARPGQPKERRPFLKPRVRFLGRIEPELLGSPPPPPGQPPLPPW